MKNEKYSSIILISLLTVLVLFFLSAAMAAETSDIDISVAVENQIQKDPGTNPNNFDISSSMGIVTLSGTVNNLLAKERAVRVAQTVKGVRSVIDQITVTPPLRSDRDIKEDIRQALIFDPISESWKINLFVDNGNVILTGTADSYAESAIIEKIAKGVRGVSSLENNMNISSQTERSAKEMEEEIKRRLYWDALVDAGLVEIEVIGSRAIISGTVGSAAERFQAQRDCWVAGITDVDSSNLEVNWWERDKELRQKKYLVKDDTAIEQAVKDALLFDPRVTLFDITVKSDAGWVTLQGTVDNLLAKRSAAIDARNTVGVWNVKNFIKVRPGVANDRLITNSVRTALLMDPTIEKYKIIVSVTNGEVYLTGTVDSYFEKAQADHIAAGIKGVRQVHNQLLVHTSQIITHSPYIDPWYTYDYDWYTYPDYIPIKSDAQILSEINDELFWSPFVDADQVQVTVDKGMATLSGTVDSWFEYSAANENALEGGAIGVDNELNVKNH